MLTCEQVRAARAGVNLSTVQRAENANGPVPMIPANERAVREALEMAGIEFITENGGGPGVGLKRARGPSSAAHGDDEA
jgi:hypothetical protein